MTVASNTSGIVISPIVSISLCSHTLSLYIYYAKATNINTPKHAMVKILEILDTVNIKATRHQMPSMYIV